MRNTSSTQEQGADGLITLAAMRAAADTVRTQDASPHWRIRIGSCTSSRGASLPDEKGASAAKGELAFA